MQATIRLNVKGTYIEWCSGWAAPFVEVMIITGMYAGVSGKIVESHKNFVRVLTAFDSVERYPPENSHDSLSNYIKPMLPKKGDKGIVIVSQEESKHALAAKSWQNTPIQKRRCCVCCRYLKRCRNV